MAREKEILLHAYNNAEVFFHKGDYTKVLKITEEAISLHLTNPSTYRHHLLQGEVFLELARKAESNDVRGVYLFASLDSYSVSSRLCPESVRAFHGCALALMELADKMGLSTLYEKALAKASLGLVILMKMQPLGTSEDDDMQSKMESLIELAREKTKCKTAMVVNVDDQVQEQKKGEQGKEDHDVDVLKKCWNRLDVKAKKEFLVLDSRNFVEYIQSCHARTKSERRNFAKCFCIDDTFRWRKWKCRICPQVNYCLVDCTWHILDKHVQMFQPPSSSRPRRLDECFASMICCGNWEPVDTAEAISLIKDKTERKEELVYVNGWSSEWAIASDERRKDMLRQFGHVLKDYCENDIMPSSVWDWLMVYTEENVKLPEVPGDYLEQCKFFKSPQCLCFLEEKNVEYLLEYVRELSTDLRAGLVLKVVDGLWVKSLVKERIDIERVSHNLLLDERLLLEGEDRDYDDVGTVKTFKSSGIYDHVIPKGDEIVSWVLDCPPINAEFVSQVAEGTQNLEIWLAALRLVRSTARKEESYYTKRDKLLTYDKMLGEAEALCDKEDKWRNAYQRSRYAMVLRRKCEQRCFVSVVKDILEGAATPRFGELDDKEFMDGTSELFTTVENDAVRRNLWKLRNSLNKKVVSIDAKILLNEWTYKKLHEFARLSVIENRLVVIPFVKLYLQDKLKSMLKTHKRKITTAAAGASAKKARR